MAGSCLVRVVGLMPSSTLWDLGDLEIAVDLCTTIHTLHGLQWLSLESGSLSVHWLGGTSDNRDSTLFMRRMYSM